ncbi:MAG TPA: hypothetical protein VJT73_13305 [Polyangiaceae bacterium]|nr:hypothetical protein [Polyangiaceae bacterium]
MDDLEQLAHCQALFWAELVWQGFRTSGHKVPSEWPGSRGQAHLLVAVSVNGSLDPLHCERLVEIILHRAQFLWREFRSFY